MRISLLSVISVTSSNSLLDDMHDLAVLCTEIDELVALGQIDPTSSLVKMPELHLQAVIGELGRRDRLLTGRDQGQRYLSQSS